METPKQVILGPEGKKSEKPEEKDRPGIIEAILFVAGNAVDKKELAAAMELTPEELDKSLDDLESIYNYDRRGLRLLRFGMHIQLTTRPEYAVYVEHLLQPVQKQSLSQAVMETLAVIAYKQPVTKGEIEQIRGVKCDYSIQSLLSKSLIAEVGRKEGLGRPILYGTTDAFLRHFCISSLEDLPEIDFESLTAKLENGGNGETGNAESESPTDKETSVPQENGDTPEPTSDMESEKDSAEDGQM